MKEKKSSAFCCLCHHEFDKIWTEWKRPIPLLPLKFALPSLCGWRQDEMTFDTATLLYLLIFYCDWQMKDSVCTVNLSGLMGPQGQWKLFQPQAHTHAHTQIHIWMALLIKLDQIQQLFSNKVCYSNLISQYNLLLHFYGYFNILSQIKRYMDSTLTHITI